MPSKPLRPCLHVGCSQLVTSGYCDQYKKDKQVYDRYRGSSTERGYGSRWSKYRLVFLRQHPLCECEECRENGRVTPATVVDHIIPHRGDQVLFWDPTNHQAMSKRCHDRKTAREDGGFGNEVK